MCRVDETYPKVRGKWIYLYRSVDRAGQTVDFMISQQSDRAGPSLHQVPDERHGRLKRFRSTAITLAGIELVHRIHKGQFSLTSLRLKDIAAPAVWNSVLST